MTLKRRSQQTLTKPTKKKSIRSSDFDPNSNDHVIIKQYVTSLKSMDVAPKQFLPSLDDLDAYAFKKGTQVKGLGYKSNQLHFGTIWKIEKDKNRIKEIVIVDKKGNKIKLKRNTVRLIFEQDMSNIISFDNFIK